MLVSPSKFSTSMLRPARISDSADGFNRKMRGTFVEVTVFTGTEMNERQNEVAEALCWLRMLMMAVTDLHWLEVLLISSFSDFGALSAEPHSARKTSALECFMIGTIRTKYQGGGWFLRR